MSNFHQTLQPKEMEVCDICGAFLVMGDAQQRVEEHLMGKQHMGYGKVRDTIEQLKVCECCAAVTCTNHLLYCCD